MDTSTQKIIPHLWFDDQAKEAAEFYASIFGNGSTVKNVRTLHDTPSGDSDIVTFELSGQPFMAISAGPLFKFNPSISFFVNCRSEDEVDELWAALSEGGEPLMPLDTYPFSEKYGWIEDRYGLSWQLILADGEAPQKIMPSLMFVGDVYGKAEEAIEFYTSVFDDTKIKEIARYGPNQEPDKEGAIMYADFKLEGQLFAAMESALEHGYAFNEAISLIVYCDSQEEIDYYWEKLSATSKAEQCGWLKDKFGVSWQVTPTAMDEMMSKGTPEQIARVTQAFLKMKKFDIQKLQEAFEGNNQ